MIIYGLIALAAALVAWLIADGRRRHAAWPRMTVGAIDLAIGVASAGLAIGHMVAVSVVASRGADFEWDFRFASLLLIGVAIATPGLLCLLVARRLVAGSPMAWRYAIAGSLMLLAVNAVLAPIQGFAVILGLLAVGNLAALASARRLYRPPHPE